MGYHRVDPSALDPPPVRPRTESSVSGAWGLERFAARVCGVARGEAFVVEPGSPQYASVPADGDSTTASVAGAPPADDVHASGGS